MTSYFNHPVLRQMLNSRYCSEADTGRSFHLYMSLCEQYRVPKVEWHSDKDLGIIYMVTGESGVESPPPEGETHGRQCSSSHVTTATPEDRVKQEKTSPRRGYAEGVSDSPKIELSGNDTASSSVCAPSAATNSNNEQFTEHSVEGSVCYSQDAGSSRKEEEAQTIFVSVSYEDNINHSFLVAVNSLRKKYPGAKLSIVPSSHWSLLGNYIVNCDVQTVVDHSSHPVCLRSKKKEGTTATVVDVGSETTNEAQDPHGAPDSLHPGCFPEAYIVKAQQQPPDDTNSAPLRSVCYPEAYIISAQQQQNQGHQKETAKSDASSPDPVCYPEANIASAQSQQQSEEGSARANRPGHRQPEAQHQRRDTAEPEVLLAASEEGKSNRSTSAQLDWDQDWTGAQAPTESWD